MLINHSVKSVDKESRSDKITGSQTAGRLIPARRGASCLSTPLFERSAAKQSLRKINPHSATIISWSVDREGELAVAENESYPSPPPHLTSSILRLLCFLTARVHRLNKFVNGSSSCLRFKLFINFVVFCVHSDSRIYITFSFLFIGILTIQISFPNNSEYFVRTLNIEDDFLRIWRRILCIFVRSNCNSSEDLPF